jgi:histidinol-phosphatase
VSTDRVPAGDLGADLALALELADVADAITVARFRAGDLVVETKPDLTPVSDADRAVEAEIRRVLEVQRPADAFLGEESGGEESGGEESGGEESGAQGGSARCWIIDPIDGTKNFVRGVPIWATLIALLVDGQPVLGVVSAPALNRRWWARSGGGAFVREADAPARPISVSRVGTLADASLGYASLPGWRDVDRYAQFLGLLDQVWRSRGYGDFYSYMLLAEGGLDLVAEPELSLWDMAALAPVVSEAGGRFTGLNGVDGIAESNALASNGLLHDQALSVIGTSPAA